MKQMTSHTKLTMKNFSPLTIRKITKYGFPIFVGIITDDDLSDLDKTIIDFMDKHTDEWENDNLQDKRNLTGLLSECLVKKYKKTEGVAVTFCIDKAFISSLFGDFMNHFQCKFEYYTLLSMSTNI